MKKQILYIVLSFLFLKLNAQIPYKYTASDSVCIKNDFEYFIKLADSRYLISRSYNNFITDENGKEVLDLSDYDNFLFYPFNDNLTPVKKKEGGKHGYIDPDGNVKIPFVYDKASNFCNGLAVVSKSGKWGIIDPLNQVVIPIIYEGVHLPKENKFPVKKNGFYGLVDLNQKTILDFKYLDLSFLENDLLRIKSDEGVKTLNLDSQEESSIFYQEVRSFSPDLNRFKLDGKWGLMNAKGKVVLENIHNRISSLEKGSARISTPDNKFGLVDEDGRSLIPLEYESMNNEHVYFIAEKEDQYFYFDKKGNRIYEKNTGQIRRIGPGDLFLRASRDSLFSFQYLNAEEVFEGLLFQEIKEVSNGMLCAKINDSWYYYPLDKSKRLGPFKSASPFSNNKAIVQTYETDKVQLIDKAGNVLSDSYDEIKKEGDFYVFKDQNKLGITNKISQSKVKMEYDEIKRIRVQDPIFKVKKNEKYGLMSDNKILLPVEYDVIQGNFLFGGVLEIIKGEEIAVFNKTGTILKEPKIISVTEETYGLTLLETETGYGIIDHTLQFQVDPIYERLLSYKDGKRCAAKINGLWGFLNREGEFIIEPKFKSVLSFGGKHNATAVQDDLGWRLIHESGKFLNEEVYSKMDIVMNAKQYYRVELNGKWGIIDSEGKKLIPIVFTEVSRRREYWELHLNDDFIRLDDDLECIHNCSENEIMKVFKANK